MIRLLVTALLVLASPVLAHDYKAKDGRSITWYSGSRCCNEQDCRPVDRHAGFTEKGELVVVTDDNIIVAIPKTVEKKLSKDNDEHVCAKVIATPQGTWTAHCHFVPSTAKIQSKWNAVASFDIEVMRNICKN